jgi:hypothetical protein
MAVQFHGAAHLSLTPEIPAEQLVSGDKAPSHVLVDELSIRPGVTATLHGVEAMSLADPVPLECDLPFRWHPPLVFPPLEGGRRLAGWFMSSGLAKVESGGAVSLTLSPSPDPTDRSMPKGWVPVGFAGVIATWDVEGDDQDKEEDGFDELNNDDVQWKSQLLQNLGLQEEEAKAEDEEEEEENEDDEDDEDGDVNGDASAELLSFMGTGQEVEPIMPHELTDPVTAHAQELVFFKVRSARDC